MPNYKLTYFNGRGRAECCRLVFAHAGVKYEDKRVQGEEWAKMKADTKLGTLPELEVDGQKFGQSRAIMFYLAREFGLYPSNPLEQLAVDEVVFVVEDLVNAVVKAMFAKEEEKEEKLKEFKETVLPKFLGFLEKLIKLNSDGKGFYVGKKITVADIASFDTLSGMLARHPGCMDAFPCVKGHTERIGAIDKIKAWMDSRPQTNF